MDSLKISLITITFNSEKTIERTLKSVLAQTYKNYEYIIVDGASKDSTMDIVRKYEPLFEGRMKWKSEPDTGIYNAMNKGIMRSTGEIIGIVNSDDWLEPLALETVVKIADGLDSSAGSLFCGSVRFHYNDGSSQLFETNEDRFYKGVTKHSFNYGAYHPAILVSADVYKEVGLFDELFKIEADIDFIYRCYIAGKKFHFTNDVLTNQLDGGISNKVNLKHFISDKKHFMKINGITGINKIIFMAKNLLRIVIKQNIPQSWLLIYRDSKY